MAFAKIDRLSLRFSASIAAIVLAGQAAGFVLVYRYASNRLLEASRQQASLATQLVHLALDDSMLKKDDHLVRGMVEGFAEADGVQRVMILDRAGVVRFSSDPEIQAAHFSQDSPTCLVCHREPAAGRSRSAMLELDGGRTLRVVDPIDNRPACHACHDPSHRINGLVVVDVDMESTLARLKQTISHLAGASSLVGLVVLGGTGLVFRGLFVKRLRRFERTAQAIAQGDLSRRVPVAGDDALTRMERQFNGMAEALEGLLGRLREQQADMERVMNSVDDGMVVLDRHRTVVAANDAFAQRFRDGHGSPIGRRCCADAPEDAVGCGDDGFCPTLACFLTGTVQTAIKRRTLPDGQVRHEEVRASPVLAEDGTVSHVVEVWRDMTGRRSAEAKLADTQRMVSLGMLASGFSHEVNTPLGSIGMCLDGIRRLCASPTGLGEPEHRRVEDYVRTAAAQVQRAGAITEQFLRLARGQTLPSAAVNLAATAYAVVALCGHKAEAVGVGLEVIGPDLLPTVVANESAVQQVLINLLFNAIDACIRGQRVTVAFQSDEHRVAVRVSDEGRGIAPEDLTRVFEPFFSRRAGGTGLGLFVSLNLARGWGGDIMVESRQSAGTTVTVVFPRGTDEARDDGGD